MEGTLGEAEQMEGDEGELGMLEEASQENPSKITRSWTAITHPMNGIA